MSTDRGLTEKLLAAERRGRGLVLAAHPLGQPVWELEAVPGPDGAALLAAARWAARLGVSVRVRPGRGGDTDWSRLADSARRQNIVDESRQAAMNLVGGLPPKLPEADEAWKIPLADSAPMVMAANQDMPALSCAQCRGVDRIAIQELAVPGVCLMENAAVAATALVMDMLAEAGAPAVAILAGGGNNGGDGFAMARGLDGMGVAVDVVLLKPASGLSGDALVNYQLMTSRPRIRVHPMESDQKVLPTIIRSKALVVDALLGTGFSGGLSHSYQNAIQAVNDSGLPVLAIDIPSGLNGDTGLPAETAIRATRTITFAALKHGLVQPEAEPYVGRLYLGDIGAPSSCYPKVRSSNIPS